MTSHTEPVELRESGGVHVYYALPVEGGATGVFEHVSTWPSRAIAEGRIAELEAADARRIQLAAAAREALTAWENEADYASSSDVADALGALLDALQKSSLI